MEQTLVAALYTAASALTPPRNSQDAEALEEIETALLKYEAQELLSYNDT